MPQLPYCVFLADSNELPQTGVMDRPVQRFDRAGLSIIYSELGMEEIAGDKFQAAALAFHEVVQAVFAQRGVIPFRFPTFLSEDELRSHLRKESQPYLNFLRAHAEDVQMEVRLWLPNAVQAPPAESGREYLQRAAERMMHMTGASHYVQHISKEIVREWKSQESRDTHRLFALIPRSRIADFRETFREKPRPTNVSMRVTGPWPATEFFAGTVSRTQHNVVSITSGETP